MSDVKTGDWAYEMADQCIYNDDECRDHNDIRRSVVEALRSVERRTAEECCRKMCYRCSLGEKAERVAGTWLHPVTANSIECKAAAIRERFHLEGK